MKRIFKVLGIVILILLLVIIAIPFVFQGNIKKIAQETINNQINAQVAFGDVDLSLFRSFPKASVRIEDLSIINNAPFEGDTLITTKKIAFDMSIKELFKNPDDGIHVHKIYVEETDVAIRLDSLGRANYDIAKKDTKNTTPVEDTNSEGFNFQLEHYEINHSSLSYYDATSKMKLVIADLNHSGTGNFSGTQMELDTKTATKISFDSDGTNYLDNNTIDLDAKLLLDLESSRYTFQENEAHLNGLPLKFDGFVQLNDNNTEMAISFENPGSDFKEFLALAPKAYTKNLDEVRTSGNFKIKGTVNGKIDDNTIPKMDINIVSNNASFQFPQLPKKVDNIQINTTIKNDTGLLKDTYVSIGNLNFRIDMDTFAANGVLENVTENMRVNMAAKGTLNLANLDRAYPLQLEGQQLNGILKADLTTNFDMESLDKERYQNVKSSGTASITDFKYASEDLPKTINITKAKVDFAPETITLDHMTAIFGQSDLSASGKIDNLMGFLFSKQDLKGLFDVSSFTFAVNDFMATTDDSSEEDPSTSTTEDALKIPAFLDATLNFDAKKVLYDNLTLLNTKGTVIIKNETAELKNVTTNMFDGNIGFDGKVSTKEATPTFDMAIAMDKVDIAKSFSALDMMKGMAPIAQSLQGALTTNLKVRGNLNDDLTPQLSTLKGNALANILNAKVDSRKTPLATKLNQKVNFLNLDKLNLKDLKTKLNFSDGKIKVLPFDVMLEDIRLTASGSHGFDQQMDHKVGLQIPAKYLGSQMGGLLAQLSEQDQKSMSVLLPIGLTGSFTDPKINMNIKQAIGELTQKIVAKQKSNIKNKVKDAVSNQVKGKIGDQIKGKGEKLLGGLLGKDTKSSTAEKSTKNATKATSQKTEEAVKDAAKNVLGGLFGKKKTKEEPKK